MFKLLTVTFMLVALGAAHPEPEGSGRSVLSSAPSPSPAPGTGPGPSPVQSNSISDSEESPTDSEDDEQQQPAPASVTRSSAISLSASPSSSSSDSRASVVTASSGRSGSIIRHHILPAKAIPLPITISTRPGVRTVIAPETITIQEPTVSKVGEVVQKIPTAVSHQSQTVVHKHARVVTPIVAPARRTISSQVYHAYHTPLVYTPQLAVVRVISRK